MSKIGLYVVSEPDKFIAYRQLYLFQVILCTMVFLSYEELVVSDSIVRSIHTEYAFELTPATHVMLMILPLTDKEKLPAAARLPV